MLRRTLLAIVLAAVVGGAYVALGPRGAEISQPTHRFVNPPWVGDATTHYYPVATLLDETRYVLDRPPRQLLILSDEVVPPDGRVTFPVSHLAPGFEHAKRVALISFYRQGTTRTRLPTQFADIESTPTGAIAHVALDVPKTLVGQTVRFNVEGVALQADADHTRRFDPIEVPRRAYLEFAIGVTQPDVHPGPLEFVLQGCVEERCSKLFQEVVDPMDPAKRGWLDRRVSLDALGGEKVSFVFEAAPHGAPSEGFSYPLWANPTLYAAKHESQDRANVILLSVDTLGAQHLPSYQYGFDTAPFMHSTFGERGTVFDHFLAAATTTPQSHMSMLTGVQPCVHGVVTGMEAAPPWLVTLAEVLRREGYETGAVTEDGWLGYNHGFGRGFNVYAENKSADIMAPDGQVDVTFARAKRWLELNRDKRFFLFLHTFQVHDPYSPPEAYQHLFTERNGTTVTGDSPRPLREIVAYDQEIRYTDDELKGLFAFLQEQGLAENTVFILTSDHGEEFFQHGLWGHGPTFYEEVTRVPLMMWGPGRIPAGRRIATLAGHIDLMPTILDLADAAPPRQIMGTSLLPWLEEAATPPDRAMFGEARVDLGVGENYEVFPVIPPGFLVQQGPRKLARYRKDQEQFEYRYYDIAKDPGEQHELFAADPQAAGDLKALVDGYEDLCARTVESQDGAAGAEQQKLELDPATEEKLRALGYLK